MMGQDRPGIAAELTEKLADGRINLRGFSLTVIGTQFLAYAAVDSLDDANKVIEILKKARQTLSSGARGVGRSWSARDGFPDRGDRLVSDGEGVLYAPECRKRSTQPNIASWVINMSERRRDRSPASLFIITADQF